MRLHVVIALCLSLLAVNAQAACINLGTAASFGLLGGSAVTNAVPGTVILGDVGVFPGSSITGFPPGVIVGTRHTTDAVAQQAQSDLTAAYLSAAGAPCPPTHNLTGIDLGTFNAGNPLLPGVYCFNVAAALTGNLTLDAQGDPNACWIFQIGSTLTTATNATVTLINGANPCNVFWQVGSSATIQTNNTFVGTIMALASITLNGGTLQGRALARNGAVTVSGSESVDTVCVPSVPCVSITKKADRTTAAVGQTITYTYTVCNCGITNITVDSVIDPNVSQNLTAAFTAANGGSAALPAGVCVVFTGTHVVTNTDPNPPVNVATVTAHDSGGTPATSSDTASVTITPTPPTVCVHMTKIGNRITATAGDSVTYTYTVCNCGTATLTVDSVIDSLTGNLTAAFVTANGGSSTLAGGACVSFTQSRTVLSTDTSPLTNSVTVNAHNGATVVSSTDTWTVTILAGPCVSVGKVADRTAASVGENIVYTFSVCNCGTVPITVSSVSDSLLGQLLPDFLAANGGSATIAPADCVTFTESRTVKTTDPNPLVNSVTVTANAGATVVTATGQATVLIVSQVLFQAVPANSLGTDLCFRGYLPPIEDAISSAPGILSIVPQGPGQPPWANFIAAAQAGVPYTIKTTALVKQTPGFTQCHPVFPAHTVTQTGTPNIRLWWPLMYETPGTTFTLSILYGTPSLFDDDGPGPDKPAWVHLAKFSKTVVADFDSLSDLLELFHELPFGLDEVPLVSDETLYPILQAKIAAAKAAFENCDLATAAFILADFELEVMDACIDDSPAFPSPTGPGTGIANSEENPACCKLLVDVEYILQTTGIGQPGKRITR